MKCSTSQPRFHARTTLGSSASKTPFLHQLRNRARINRLSRQVRLRHSRSLVFWTKDFVPELKRFNYNLRENGHSRAKSKQIESSSFSKGHRGPSTWNRRSTECDPGRFGLQFPVCFPFVGSDLYFAHAIVRHCFSGEPDGNRERR